MRKMAVVSILIMLLLLLWANPALAPTETLKMIRQNATMATVARSGNVVTVTLAANFPNNNLKTGQSIYIDAADNTFDGTHTITGVTNQKTFTYTQTAADVASKSDAGTAGGHYTSLTAWDAANGGLANKGLVALDANVVAECYDDWPTGLSDTILVDGFLIYDY